MSIDQRKYMYNIAEVDGNTELDYLDTHLLDMELETSRKFMVGDVTKYRPDLISFLMYGNYNFGWLIAYHNGMLDPVAEFTTGRSIDIPSMDSYYRFYNRYARKV